MRLIFVIACLVINSAYWVSADYVAVLHQDGRTEAALYRGQSIDINVDLFSSGVEQHNAAILRVVFSSSGLTLKSYQWQAPYLTGSDEDDSKPAASKLPLRLSAESLSGRGYPEGEVDFELSNVVPMGTSPGYLEGGIIAKFRVEVPPDYSGPEEIRFSIVPDTVSRGLQLIKVTTFQPFVLNVQGAPAQAAEKDDDNDGISNLVEYALNLDPAIQGAPPMTRTSPGLPVVSVENKGGQPQLGFTFRSYPEKKDIVYQVQVSDDLIQWVDVPDAVVELVGDAQIRKVELPLQAQKKFMRLQIRRVAPGS